MFDELPTHNEVKSSEGQQVPLNIEVDQIDRDVEAKRRAHNHNMTVLAVCLITFFGLLYCIAVETNILSTVVIKLQTTLKEYYKNEPATVLIIILVILVISYILVLPTHTIINILTSLIIGDIVSSFVILTIYSLIAATAIFLLCRYCLRDYLLGLFKDNIFFSILLEESKEAPYKTAFLTRIIFISAGLKEYILALIGNPYPSFIISGLFVHGFFVLEAVLIAQGITNIQEFLDSKKTWAQKSFIEKLSFVMVLVLIVVTVVIMGVIGYYATKKVKERQNEDIKRQNGDKIMEDNA